MPGYSAKYPKLPPMSRSKGRAMSPAGLIKATEVKEPWHMVSFDLIGP
jgi:hypothetical protein